MAILKKGPVLIRRAQEATPLAMGMCYLAGRSAPSGRADAGGTIARLQWAPGADPAEAGPGEYHVEFSDGVWLDIAVTQHLQSACGPEVLRFRALGPLNEGPRASQPARPRAYER
ncbi:MAG: hypothetical protein HY689_02250 [Chloroflexi bacterium]|nr:hypothetical protein [Chloroflexota bacterium]